MFGSFIYGGSSAALKAHSAHLWSSSSAEAHLEELITFGLMNHAGDKG